MAAILKSDINKNSYSVKKKSKPIVFPISYYTINKKITTTKTLSINYTQRQSLIIMSSSEPLEGLTPLHLACLENRSEDAALILSKNKNSVNGKTKSGKTALHFCAEGGSLKCLEYILSANPQLINTSDEEGYTPLHLAVINGNKEIVKSLISAKADLSCTDNEKHSLVHWASVCGELEILDLLLLAGAPSSTPDIHLAHPIHYAAQMCGHESGGAKNETWNRVQSTMNRVSSKKGLGVLKRLLEHSVPVNVKDKDGREPLLWAASAGSADGILCLVNSGASVQAEDKDGLTALHCAASRGHTDCLETLIALCGSEVDVIDNNGCTGLFYAVTLGHADSTELLLNFGSEPNRQDRKGRTPAHCGASKGQLETLKLLLKHGGNLWLRNVRGDLPLHEAVISKRKDLVLWLLSQQPHSVNAPNNDGRCPLHLAALNNNVEMVKILIDYRAEINSLMRTGKGVTMTPLDAAMHRGNSAVAKFIQLHGGLPASALNDSAALSRRLNSQMRSISSLNGSQLGHHESSPDIINRFTSPEITENLGYKIDQYASNVAKSIVQEVPKTKFSTPIMDDGVQTDSSHYLKDVETQVSNGLSNVVAGKQDLDSYNKNISSKVAEKKVRKKRKSITREKSPGRAEITESTDTENERSKVSQSSRRSRSVRKSSKTVIASPILNIVEKNERAAESNSHDYDNSVEKNVFREDLGTETDFYNDDSEKFSELEKVAAQSSESDAREEELGPIETECVRKDIELLSRQKSYLSNTGEKLDQVEERTTETDETQNATEETSNENETEETVNGKEYTSNENETETQNEAQKYKEYSSSENETETQNETEETVNGKEYTSNENETETQNEAHNDQEYTSSENETEETHNSKKYSSNEKESETQNKNFNSKEYTSSENETGTKNESEETHKSKEYTSNETDSQNEVEDSYKAKIHTPNKNEIETENIKQDTQGEKENLSNNVEAQFELEESQKNAKQNDKASDETRLEKVDVVADKKSRSRSQSGKYEKNDKNSKNNKIISAENKSRANSSKMIQISSQSEIVSSSFSRNGERSESVIRTESRISVSRTSSRGKYELNEMTEKSEKGSSANMKKSKKTSSRPSTGSTSQKSKNEVNEKQINFTRDVSQLSNSEFIVKDTNLNADHQTIDVIESALENAAYVINGEDHEDFKKASETNLDLKSESSNENLNENESLKMKESSKTLSRNSDVENMENYYDSYKTENSETVNHVSNHSSMQSEIKVMRDFSTITKSEDTDDTVQEFYNDEEEEISLQEAYERRKRSQSKSVPRESQSPTQIKSDAEKTPPSYKGNRTLEMRAQNAKGETKKSNRISVREQFKLKRENNEKNYVKENSTKNISSRQSQRVLNSEERELVLQEELLKINKSKIASTNRSKKIESNTQVKKVTLEAQPQRNYEKSEKEPRYNGKIRKNRMRNLSGDKTSTHSDEGYNNFLRDSGYSDQALPPTSASDDQNRLVQLAPKSTGSLRRKVISKRPTSSTTMVKRAQISSAKKNKMPRERRKWADSGGRFPVLENPSEGSTSHGGSITSEEGHRGGRETKRNNGSFQPSRRPRSKLTFTNGEDLSASLSPFQKRNMDVDTPISVTQAMQASMRKYHLERRIFQELLELKRLQIRAGKANEQLLVKRLADGYKKAGLSINYREYDGAYTFRNFEKYLYDQLRLLQANRKLLPRFAPSDDLEKLSTALKKMNATKLPFLDEIERSLNECNDHGQCSQLTHRCHHAAHAYTGVPCAAYITKGKRAPFLPKVDPLRAPGPTNIVKNSKNPNSNVQMIISPREDTSTPITVEVQQGANSQVFSLPNNKLDPSKNYYVSLSIKPSPSPPPNIINENYQQQVVHEPSKSTSPSNFNQINILFDDLGSLSAPPTQDSEIILK